MLNGIRKSVYEHTKTMKSYCAERKAFIPASMNLGKSSIIVTFDPSIHYITVVVNQQPQLSFSLPLNLFYSVVYYSLFLRFTSFLLLLWKLKMVVTD